MAAFDARSLPGVFFDIQPRVLEEKLPRMDIAVFVGFAAQGELHTPTVVEDAEQFATLFGDDLPLAWDAERGDYVYAYLPSSVRAFFRNGGRRCWIVRVPTPEPDQFTADVFLDSRLKETGVDRLIPDADFIRYQGDQQQWLAGIHAVLEAETDEATLIAVPDAVHRGWRVATPPAPTPPAPSLPPLRPEWWRFLDCNPPPTIEPVSEPQWGHFLDCSIRILPPPQLSTSSNIVETGVFTLSWTFSVADADAQYVLEEALFLNFSDAVVIYEGTATLHELYGRGPADYYYRVRAAVKGNVSDWSEGIVVRVASGPRLEVKSPSEYSEATLLTIHRALLRLCAARGDLFAVLTLPEHYHEYEAIAYAGQLRQTVEFAPPGTAPSYGALYHPWLIGREETRPAALRSTPSCGAVCGVFAYRAITRGAWVAPANEPLRGVMALTPTLSRDRWSGLQEAQVNVIRQEPQGFLVLDADTLDNDGDFALINVRRLMSILRRLALQLGVTYVFEPNDAAFRRAVKRGFEARLEQMFIRGAFAGDTPATSYQVVVEDPVNTPQSVEQGRFIVELKVAPSVPLRFLTVRLEQTGERGLVLEGR